MIDASRRISVCLALGLACEARRDPPVADPAVAERPSSAASSEPRFEVFELRSDVVSRFDGRDAMLIATVLTPPGFDASRGHPTIFHVHGFGTNHANLAKYHGRDTADRMTAGTGPPFVHVYLDANHRLGHHVFADSQNTGPWATALVRELIPALEARYGTIADASARFVSGHSSGGWSALWLQVAHPDVFGGAWAMAPDPVDLRDFVGVDLHVADNMYRAPTGEPIQLVREGDRFVKSLEAYVRDELVAAPQDRVFASFDAVFGPRGADGDPAPLFERRTGAIDREVADSWNAFDIRLRLHERWLELGPQLTGKLHVFVGTRDTYRLEGAVHLLAEELRELGSDAEIVFVPDRDHETVMLPTPTWPEGLPIYIERSAWATFLRSPKGAAFGTAAERPH